jgi:hypothetical protein
MNIVKAQELKDLLYFWSMVMNSNKDQEGFGKKLTL